MTPERRMEGLAVAPAEEREQLADRILAAEGADVRVLSGPEVATAAARLRVAGTQQTFVAGRTVLTTCQVTLAGTRGDGVVQGRAARGALAAAICDAEAERRGPYAEAVEALVLDAEERRAAALSQESSRVEMTRLDDEAGRA